MVPVIERLTGIRACGVGEGPHWDAKEQILYMIDVYGSIIRYSPKTNESIYHEIGKHVSFIIPIKGRNNEFVIGSELEVLTIKWDFDRNQIVEKDVLVRLTDEVEGARVNDAKCDAKGRLWFGTIGKDYKEQGSLYSFSKSSGLKKHSSGICISNGLGFSLDNKKLYFIDTMKNTVSQYAVDIDKNTCEFEKVVIKLDEAGVQGMPDGMTVDSEGKLWVACIFAAKVIRVDPSAGKILERVEFDKSYQITSVAFGGPKWEDLYVVSGNIKDLGGFKAFEHTSGAPEAGATYRVTNLGSKGLKPFEFNAEL